MFFFILSLSIPAGAACVAPAAARPVARFLTAEDVPALIALEEEKWTTEQAATGEEMAERIVCHPDLAVGAFCPVTGKIVASLFMKPVVPSFWEHARDWHDCAMGVTPLRTSSLFGISLSSSRPEGVEAILAFFWPYALAAGWRHIYLGSPIPGWRDWQARHPGRSVNDYVLSKGPRGLPIDPQLRYYFGRGFKEIICVKRDYFPHAASRNVGVILRGTVPLSGLAPVWRGLKPANTRQFTQWLAPHVL